MLPDASTDDATPRPEQTTDRRHLLVFHRGASWMYQLPTEGAIVIGRSASADLQIDSTSISRRHAEIAVHGEKVTIKDLGSHNGTEVNRRRIDDATELRSGDTITLRDTTLILHCPKPTTAPTAILDATQFRHRLESELERAVRHARSFSILVLLWPGVPADRGATAKLLEAQLRRIDCLMWADDATAHLMLAEAGEREAAAFVARVRKHLDPHVRIGHVSCPADGAHLDELIASAASAAAGASLGETTHTQRSHETLDIGSRRVIVADPAVIRLYALIERLAPTELPILITGETGTGKELAASAIHAMSRRRDRQLISLNCAAIPDTLVESELFGYEKGAFSGAVTSKLGQLEVAHKSTLFLDEIGELPLGTQAKLLRVLENRRLTRVGDVKEREVDVRIVAATNRELEAEVEAGRFRQDLYFRLTGAVLAVPPLRARHKEIPLLAARFLDEACTQTGRAPMRIGASAKELLLSHPWPGNVRELRNLMHYAAAAHSEPELTAEHLRPRLSRARATTSAPEPELAGRFRPLADEIRELEIARIRAALEATGGNQTRAAALLSVPIRTFSEKVKLYGIPANKRRGAADT